MEMVCKHVGSVIDETQEYQVLECHLCGFKHLNPIPSQETLDAFYKEQYYDAHKPDYIKRDIQEETYWRIAFEERLDFFEQRVQGRDILDVGCGSGSFLKYAQESGWRCTGVEPSRVASAQAKKHGLTIFNTAFDDFYKKVGNVRYDAVHLKNVLEHVPNPAEILEKCHNLLTKGGIMYIEVPNDYNLVQRIGVKIVGERKSWICIPDHINYFDFQSAEQLVSRCRFTILKRDTTYPMYLFLWLGQNFIKYKQVGIRAHQQRMRLELFLYYRKLNFIKRFSYFLLARMGLGRTVILYCQK